MYVFTKMKNISMKVLANDGVSQSGIDALTNAGIEVITTKVAQEQLENYINENNISVLLVRSATTARKALIDACPGLKTNSATDDEDAAGVFITLKPFSRA